MNRIDPDNCLHNFVDVELDAWGIPNAVCEDCGEEFGDEDTRSFYRDPDTGKVTW